MNRCSVIITASSIPSHPAIDYIQCVLESLKYLHLLPSTPIILAHDFSDRPEFIDYLCNLKRYCSDKPNIKIVVRDSHGHLTGNVRNAFESINTEYILLLQHDLPFIRGFKLEKVLEDLDANPCLKHVRFNKRTTTKVAWDSHNDLFGKQHTATNYTYTRTPAWSDQNHLCRSSYYRDVVLKECEDGSFMENQLFGKSTTEETHEKYGTYIFGGLHELAYIQHIDGRMSFTVDAFMRPKDRQLFYKYLASAKVYLEYGSGGSTFQASQLELRSIISVESDVGWHMQLLTQIKRKEHIQFKVVDLKSKPNTWGRPGPDSTPDDWCRYSEVVRTLDTGIRLDLVLIDGRFRVACCLKCFDVISSECRIVFDDFLTRPYYHVVLDFYEIVEKTDDACLVVLKKKDVLPPPYELIARYELIAD